MKISVATVAAIGLVGCAPFDPAQFRAVPELSQQEANQVQSAQSRTLPIRSDAVFPAVLGVLMDNGYVIRSANPELGLVTFYRQWDYQTRRGVSSTQEGSAVFSAAGPNQTRVRLLVTGNWQRSYGTIFGVQRFDTEDYTKLLDLLERGLDKAKQ